MARKQLQIYASYNGFSQRQTRAHPGHLSEGVRSDELE